MSDEATKPSAGSYSAGVSKLEDLVAGAVADGIEPAGPVTVVSAVWHGDQAITLTYRDTSNQPREQLLYRTDEGTFSVHEGTRRAWSFDGDGQLVPPRRRSPSHPSRPPVRPLPRAHLE